METNTEQQKIEFRAIDMSMTGESVVEGYALLWNTRSKDLGGFYETIDPHALDNADMTDVVALFNHGRDNLLARYRAGRDNNTLSLEKDDLGLRFSFSLPDTDLGKSIKEGIRRGDIDSMSFGFTCKRDEWEKLDDGTILRTIKEIGTLSDISIVVRPAYRDTSVILARGLEFIENEAMEKAEEVEKREEEQTAPETPENKPENKPEETAPDYKGYYEEIRKKYL